MTTVETVQRSREDLLAAADQYLVGGCLGMFRLPDESATVFARGEGSHIYDVEGRDFVDFVMGSGPMILGHSHPSVVAAVREQVGRGSTFYGLNEPAIELAERVVEASPCGELIRFTSSGTEGTFAALRIARAFSGREKVLKFEGGWHGAHDYAQVSASNTTPSDYPNPTVDSGGIPKGASGTMLVTPFNDAQMATEVIAANRSELAAVIVEPLQRAVPPEPGFLAALRTACTDNDVLLIFDEVVTGFRLAWGGAQQYFDVVPDLAVYGKTISGGFPLAAVCGRTEVMRCADPRRRSEPEYVFVSGTTNGNPVSATAGLATLAELANAGSYDRLFTTAARLKQGLEEQADARDLPLRVLGCGPVLQPFFTRDLIRNYADTLRADAGLARQFGIELLRRDIFHTPGGKFYISTAHTEADIDRTLEASDGAFRAIRESALAS